MVSIAFVGELLASSVGVTIARARRGPLRPSWSWTFELIARALKRRAAVIARLDWQSQRKAWSAMNGPAPILRKVKQEPVEHASMRAVWFEPKEGPSTTSVVLYLHGGSFIYGSIETHREMLAHLALATGGRVLAIDYRLAPEHPFPAALEDCLRGYRTLRDSGIEASRIVVAGDSAGGNLALQVAKADDPPAAAILFSPWADLSASGGTLETNAAYDYAEPDDFVRWAACYLSGADVRDPRASPLYHDFAGLPPLFVSVGTAEMIHDQVTELVRRVRDAGVRVELYEHPDGIHNHQVFAGLFPECGAVFERIGRFVREIV
jgi:acetyl esterase/lipase